MYIIMLCLVIIIAIFIVLNYLYIRTNYYKNSNSQLEKFIMGVPYELEVVNTGSSYARYAFDYDRQIQGYKGFNFGLQPQSIAYDYRILKQYVKHLKKDCVILISLPNFIFAFVDYKKDSSNAKYYFFLNPKYILRYNKIKDLVIRKFPILTDLKNVIYIFKDIHKLNNYDLIKNMMTRQEVERDAKSRIDGWKRQFGLKNMMDIKLPNELEENFIETVNILEDMIQFCYNFQCSPVLVIPPTTDILNNLISKEFLAKILYDNIEKANKNKVPVLNYLYDERFQDYSLYINSDMLNKDGREKFTQVVLDDLKNLGLLRKEN